MADAEIVKPVQLPDKFDPRSESLKKKIHPKADRLNFVEARAGKAVLCCGATRRSKLCRQLAGTGTLHFGYGRCKYHGGLNTGPKTEEGKAKTSQNARKHGLYSAVLSDEEEEVYQELRKARNVTLMEEIFVQKAKIVVYLRKWKAKHDTGGEYATKTWRRSSDSYTEYYYAGTIEDPFLQKAFDQLRRMVDSHAKLTQTSGEDLINQINNELRAASKVDVSASWGGKAVRREGTEDEPGTE